MTKSTYEGYVAEMWRLGGSAWRQLFGNDPDGSAEALGRLIRNLDLPLDSLIQITCREDARNFVFPWSMLRPDPAAGAVADPDEFWGLRYNVEQTNRTGARNMRLDGEPVEIATIVDPCFPQARLTIRRRWTQ